MFEAEKEGRAWQVAKQEDVAWVAANTKVGRTIVSAIPPVFQEYATVSFDLDFDISESQVTLIKSFTSLSKSLDWWLGFLDTGNADLVFWQVPKVRLYSGWQYVCVKAGPLQALSWRSPSTSDGKRLLPDLMFPQDRSWLFSTLWDDTWSCVGGATSAVEALSAVEGLSVRTVGLNDVMTPPGRDLI